jgi:hypothetical protein
MKYSARGVTFLAAGVASFGAILFAASRPAKAGPVGPDVLGMERPACQSRADQAALIILGLAQDGTVTSAVSLRDFDSRIELTSEDPNDGLGDLAEFEAEQSGQRWTTEQADDRFELDASLSETDSRDLLDYEYSLPQERYGYANGGWHATVADENGSEYSDEIDSAQDADESDDQWLETGTQCDRSRYDSATVLTDETSCDSATEESDDNQSDAGMLNEDQTDGQLWSSNAVDSVENFDEGIEDEQACDANASDRDQDGQAVWELDGPNLGPEEEETDWTLAVEQSPVARCEGAANDEALELTTGLGGSLAALVQETCRGLDNALRSLVREAVRVGGVER